MTRAHDLAAGGISRSLARVVVALRWPIVLVWVVGAIAATLYLPSLGENRSAPFESLLPADSRALAVQERSAQHFRFPLNGESVVVQRAPDGLTPSAQERVFGRAAEAADGAGGEEERVAFALPITNADKLVPGSREQSTTAITYLLFTPETEFFDQVDLANEYAASVDQPGDALVGVTGVVPARIQEFEEIENALPLVETATVLLIALVLAFTYRAVAAPLVTLLTAAVAYLVAIRVVPWVGQEVGLSTPREIEPILVVLLLGIVTDYSIFFLSGMRARLRAGEERLDAARHTTARFLPTVATAGLIVSAGAAALLAGQLDFFRALGPGLAIAALVALAAALTLVPALLAILGRALFWPGKHSLVPSPEQLDTEPGIASRRSWRWRMIHFSTSRPVALVIVVVAASVLIAAASGLQDLDLGFTNIQGLPKESETRRAAAAAETGFADGILAPTEILVESENLGSHREALVGLQGMLERRLGVAGVVGPAQEPRRFDLDALVSSDGSAARYAVVLDREPLGGEAIDRVDALEQALPGMLTRAGLEGATSGVAGPTALAAETVDSTVDDLGRIALAVLGINLLLLVLFLRSLVAPLFLLAGSVLAVAATLGLTAFLFQGVLGYGEVTYFVPFAAAVLLVSLGSDYNVFVVGQMWDEAQRQPLREAIATAAPRASKSITVAGLALAGSFALLAIVPLRAFRELAFALSVGVLLDAFVVRSLLVPALVSLFRDASWWPGRRRIRFGRGAAGRLGRPGQVEPVDRTLEHGLPVSHEQAANDPVRTQ